MIFRLNVQESLAEVRRFTRAGCSRVQQAQRQQDRQALAASVDELFEHLAAFRQEFARPAPGPGCLDMGGVDPPW